jgi:ankyrin repeat protein
MDQPRKHGARARRLVEAAGEGRLDEVRQLLATGVDVNAPAGGGTALSDAAATDRVEVVRELLAAGADPMIPTNEGLMPLSCARLPEVARLLIEAGAPVDCRNRYGTTALFLNAHAGVELADLLLSRGADVEAANDDGVTPLIWAAWRDRPEVVRRLLEAGADPNRRCRKGRTALHRTNKPETIRLLIRAGADVNARDREGATVLRLYAWQLPPDMVAELLDHGADPNAADAVDRLTPLMEAARGGDPEVVRVLMERGGNPTLRDRTGRTALDIARSRFNFDPEVRPRVVGYLGGGASGDQTSE